jgi:hypothetical protein
MLFKRSIKKFKRHWRRHLARDTLWSPKLRLSSYHKGNLHKIKVDLARKGQIETYKRWLNARKSLQKEGSILASDALKNSKKNRRIAAELELKKARKALLTIESKEKNKLKARGVQARKDEKTRRLFIQQAQADGNTFIPTDKWIPQFEILKSNQLLPK